MGHSTSDNTASSLSTTVSAPTSYKRCACPSVQWDPPVKPMHVIPADLAAVTPATLSSTTIQRDGEVFIFPAAYRKISGCGFPFLTNLVEKIFGYISSYISVSISPSASFAGAADDAMHLAVFKEDRSVFAPLIGCSSVLYFPITFFLISDLKSAGRLFPISAARAASTASFGMPAKRLATSSVVISYPKRV